jgi:hypothetical protein
LVFGFDRFAGPSMAPSALRFFTFSASGVVGELCIDLGPLSLVRLWCYAFGTASLLCPRRRGARPLSGAALHLIWPPLGKVSDREVHLILPAWPVPLRCMNPCIVGRTWKMKVLQYFIHMITSSITSSHPTTPSAPSSIPAPRSAHAHLREGGRGREGDGPHPTSPARRGRRRAPGVGRLDHQARGGVDLHPSPRGCDRIVKNYLALTPGRESDPLGYNLDSLRTLAK